MPSKKKVITKKPVVKKIASDAPQTHKAVVAKKPLPAIKKAPVSIGTKEVKPNFFEFVAKKILELKYTDKEIREEGAKNFGKLPVVIAHVRTALISDDNKKYWNMRIEAGVPVEKIVCYTRNKNNVLIARGTSKINKEKPILKLNKIKADLPKD